MIKNIFLKNLLINSVFKGISVVNQVVPKDDNQILLYSDLGFRDNIKYLYDYLIEQGYNQKYKIVCAVKDYEKLDNDVPKNVEFVSPVKGVLKYLTSNHVFYCFGRLPINTARNQRVIQMWHGTSFKGFAQNMKKSAAHADKFYTYVYASSEYFRPIVEKKFNCSPDHIAICGHPRTDVMYQTKPDYDLGDFKKVIMWMPTFRQSKTLGMTDVVQASILPFLKDSELGKFDDFLRSQDVEVIVKLHPMQDVTAVKLTNFTNLRLLSNAKFDETGWDLYKLLSCSDALITDYSSVFYDYLLLNRPIGFTEDDVDEYSQKRGFAVDPKKFRPGTHMKSLDDLKQFIMDTVQNQDQFKEQRKEINKMANQFQDGKNCLRSLTLSNIGK
ncbi:CDP-glycerol glycerophosphotransferase family protein [Lactiplantibacillus paraplantarum]|uniref:CDP-glycerol glycerophosphotransferase family protein n=1 Tax=Lactiplantibacillus paraplantarum TaxID=60520 RepID=UPI0023AA5C95|nr:CDP-glycerol glycerophosphotransferase family protein [Lactiplantibacillus paraplantarum]WEE36919.1 CDP-glycerol glycerophosphotransferase family protein [Lactiplantibacillus paraplantarum]